MSRAGPSTLRSPPLRPRVPSTKPRSPPACCRQAGDAVGRGFSTVSHETPVRRIAVPTPGLHLPSVAPTTARLISPAARHALNPAIPPVLVQPVLANVPTALSAPAFPPALRNCSAHPEIPRLPPRHQHRFP